MDLSKIKPADTVAVELRNPETDEPIGVVVQMRHKTSREVQAVVNAFQRRVAQQRTRTVPPEVMQQFVTDQIVAAVASWEWKGDAQWNGEKPACTEAKVREVLDLEWIRDQLSAGFVDESAFFRRNR
jgi:hypothetical protein